MFGPFTEERQQQLMDSAQEFTTQFAKEYNKMFALAMLQKIEAEVTREVDERKLYYRNWQSVERPDLFRGECYMKQGEGPGAFGKWNKVFLKEMQNYNIAVYPNEKACDAGKKPKTVLRVAGYKAQRDPSRFYSRSMRNMASGLGLTQPELDLLTKMSPYSWALSHPWRTNYVFQLHQGKNPLCGCFGVAAVEPDDAGEEFADERNVYLDAFERCVSYASPRDDTSASGKGFDLTVKKMTSAFDNLSGFKDDGLEAEILVDMLLQECLSPMQNDMLNDLQGPVSLRILAWYKTRGLVQVSMQKVADPAWGQMSKRAQQLGEKMEPQVKRGIGPILKVKGDVKRKLRERLASTLDKCLGKYISPHVEPVLRAFEHPMTVGFGQSREIFKQHVSKGLPADKRQRNLYLDNLPRTYHHVKGMSAVAAEVVKPLSLLKRSSEEIFGDLDPSDLKNQALQSLLETLDAALYTLERFLDDGGKQHHLVEQILQAYDHDVIVTRSNFVSDVVKSILIGGFKKALSPAADPVIEDMDGEIPEDLQDFVSVEGLYDELVDSFVGESIQKGVERSYPRPR